MRLVLVGAIGALLLLGALNAAPSHAASAQDEPHGHSSYVVQRDATIAPSATSTSRSHRLVVPGLFLVGGGVAAIAARGMSSRRRHLSRRRAEQFHVRRRGPPVLLVAH